MTAGEQEQRKLLLQIHEASRCILTALEALGVAADCLDHAFNLLGPENKKKVANIKLVVDNKMSNL